MSVEEISRTQTPGALELTWGVSLSTETLRENASDLGRAGRLLWTRLLPLFRTAYQNTLYVTLTPEGSGPLATWISPGHREWFMNWIASLQRIREDENADPFGYAAGTIRGQGARRTVNDVFVHAVAPRTRRLARQFGAREFYGLRMAFPQFRNLIIQPPGDQPSPWNGDGLCVYRALGEQGIHIAASDQEAWPTLSYLEVLFKEQRVAGLVCPEFETIGVPALDAQAFVVLLDGHAWKPSFNWKNTLTGLPSFSVMPQGHFPKPQVYQLAYGLSKPHEVVGFYIDGAWNGDAVQWETWVEQQSSKTLVYMFHEEALECLRKTISAVYKDKKPWILSTSIHQFRGLQQFAIERYPSKKITVTLLDQKALWGNVPKWNPIEAIGDAADLNPPDQHPVESGHYYEHEDPIERRRRVSPLYSAYYETPFNERPPKWQAVRNHLNTFQETLNTVFNNETIKIHEQPFASSFGFWTRYMLLSEGHPLNFPLIRKKKHFDKIAQALRSVPHGPQEYVYYACKEQERLVHIDRRAFYPHALKQLIWKLKRFDHAPPYVKSQTSTNPLAFVVVKNLHQSLPLWPTAMSDGQLAYPRTAHGESVIPNFIWTSMFFKSMEAEVLYYYVPTTKLKRTDWERLEQRVTEAIDMKTTHPLYKASLLALVGLFCARAQDQICICALDELSVILKQQPSIHVRQLSRLEEDSDIWRVQLSYEEEEKLSFSWDGYCAKPSPFYIAAYVYAQARWMMEQDKNMLRMASIPILYQSMDGLWLAMKGTRNECYDRLSRILSNFDINWKFEVCTHEGAEYVSTGLFNYAIAEQGHILLRNAGLQPRQTYEEANTFFRRMVRYVTQCNIDHPVPHYPLYVSDLKGINDALEWTTLRQKQHRIYFRGIVRDGGRLDMLDSDDNQNDSEQEFTENTPNGATFRHYMLSDSS